MLVPNDLPWHKTCDVAIIGYGMAGAVAAITAHDAGAKVIILEKQPADTHCTASSMSSGTFVCPNDVQGAITYLKTLWKVSDDLYWTPPDIIEAWAIYASQNKDWMEKLGAKLRLVRKGGEHPGVPGADSIELWSFRGLGLPMMEMLYGHIKARGIEVVYSTPARELLTNLRGEVIGVMAKDGMGEAVSVKALRGVILCCGGFEYNEEMKLQYLKVYPSWFDAHPANTGDGVKMAMKVGADLWHMNCVSARFAAKFPGFPAPFKFDFGGKGWITRLSHDQETAHPCGFIITDRYGRRYTNENFRVHSVYYETTSFDTHRLEYPRVPSYFIFDRVRMASGPLVQTHSGPAGPHRLYTWSPDNSAELRRGWITEGKTVGELARKLGMTPSVLRNTIGSWNGYCENGADPKFGRNPRELVPLNNPPFYAVQLLPGGANTQGGPRRNKLAQIVDPDGKPIPGLYEAGELGSVYGMINPAGGCNLAECIAFGRIAGENAAKEEARSE
ncbi:MAG: FAD-binding protein [Chloroflexi bacterium]|nr:FAD-binding protein [Chloroflexota bacterium]